MHQLQLYNHHGGCLLKTIVSLLQISHLTAVVRSLSTRHVFFTHVKEDLHNGHLRMGSEQAEELSALLAQAEFGDYNQNTAQYWYSELCGEELCPATINRYI